MPRFQASGAGTTGSINISNLRVTTPVISNPVITFANVEQSFTFPANTVRFKIKARETSTITISYVSASEYITIYPGSEYDEDNIERGSLTIYIKSNKANQIIEIISWS